MSAQISPIEQPPSSREVLVYRCGIVPEASARDWTMLRSLLPARERLRLGQSWLAREEERFLPAFVTAGWSAEYIYVYAVLEDRDIFNPLVGFNQPFYSKGDIFEILIRRGDSENYFEFHITPNNNVMQLSFPRRESLGEFREAGGRTGNLIETFQIPKAVLETYREVLTGQNQWIVLAKIPADTIKHGFSFEAGDVLRVSFCRYDYTRESPVPVLSSTSPHPVCSFHRQEEWREMKLVGE